MDEQAIWTVAATAAAVFAGSLIRTLTGFGFSLAAVPLLALIWPADQAVAIAVLFQTVGALHGVSQQSRHVDWRLFFGVAIGAPVGLVPGLALLQWLPESVLRVTLAGLILLSVVAIMTGARLRGPITPLRLALVGAGSGFTQGLAGAAGPPLMTALLAMPTLSPARIRATATAIFLVFGLASLVALGFGGSLDGLSAGEYGIVGAGMLAGYFAGDRLFRLTGDSGFRRMSLLLLAFSALITLVPLW